MSRIVIPAGQAYAPPLVRHAKKGCIEARASQLFVYNMINYGTNVLQMIELGHFLMSNSWRDTVKCGRGRVDRWHTSVVIPKAHTSAAADIVNLSALKCSGAIQSKVPSRSPLTTRLKMLQQGGRNLGR